MRGDFELTGIEEAAAAWMIRRDGGLTPAEEHELAVWLRADPRHAATFEALAQTWHLLGEMQPAATATAEPRAGRARKLAWFPLALGAAAALAIGFAGWSRYSQKTDAGRDEYIAMTAATEAGVLRKVELPDGSVIQLNAESGVEVRFAREERRVVLRRGEAHFTVATNRARPFIVTAAGVDVRVVGTVFNVRLGTEAVDVLVTEGRVVVAAPEDRARRAGETGQGNGEEVAARSLVSGSLLSELGAGQKVSIALGAPLPSAALSPVAVSLSEISQTLAWQARRLDFEATPLSDIVAEINRHNRHQLIIADPRLNAERFGGSFPAGDYETFVRMLEANFGVMAERKSDRTLLRVKAR